MRSTRSISIVAASALLAISAGAASAQPVTVPNLAIPRGLSLDGDSVLVAEQKGGRILAIAADGSVTTVAEGIVVGEYTSPEGPTVVGVNAVSKSGDTYFFTVGGSLGTVAGSEAAYTMKTGEAPVLLADLGAYEKANNTGGDVTQEGKPDIDSNPYDLVADSKGGAYVVDAAANAIFHVDASGAIAILAQFPDLPNPLAGTVGGPTIDQVPTGITMGPDGALYVATLTGFPFATGAAHVYRVDTAGTVSTYAEGLTTATDLAFDTDGSLLVTEFSTDFLKQAPGRLVRVKDGQVTEVAGGLISPTGVVVTSGGKILVTQEFPGVVAEVAAQ